MNKKLLVGIIALAIILTACIPKQDNAFKEVDIKKIGEDVKEKINEKFGQQEQLQVLKDYYESIENNISEDVIMKNIKDNITKLDKEKADEMLIQLENYLYSNGYDTKKVIDKLEPFVENSSEEFKSYFNIWKTETDKQTTDGEGLNISAEEIIDRALDIERHSRKFPGNTLKEKLDALYKAYISLSLRGLGNPYIFAKDGEQTLNPDLLDMYKEKINENPDSRTGKILNMYITELEKDSYDLNGDNVNYFYENIDQIIEQTK